MSNPTFVPAQHPRNAAGRFAAVTHSEADTELATNQPETVTVLNNHSEPVVLNTAEYGWDAAEVFSQGQCGAFAAALAQWYPDTTIKSATAQGGNVLVHVWVEEDELVLDGSHYYQPADQLIEEMYYQWGSIDVQEHTRDELVEWLSGPSVPNEQNWEAAEQMIPGYLEWAPTHV